MSASKYELLVCEGCGKSLGYVRLRVKTIPPETIIRLKTGFYQKIEKSAYCEQCFGKLSSERK